MSALTDYTSYDNIRGALGVSSKEVPDATLALEVYLNAVEQYMYGKNDTLLTNYATVAAVTAGSRSTVQAQFYALFRMVATYVVAKAISGGSIDLFAPQTITDGKARQDRVTDPFKALREDVAASLSLWMDRLGDCLTRLDATQSVSVTTRTYAAGIGLAVDPVAGV